MFLSMMGLVKAVRCSRNRLWCCLGLKFDGGGPAGHAFCFPAAGFAANHNDGEPFFFTNSAKKMSKAGLYGGGEVFRWPVKFVVEIVDQFRETADSLEAFSGNGHGALKSRRKLREPQFPLHGAQRDGGRCVFFTDGFSQIHQVFRLYQPFLEDDKLFVRQNDEFALAVLFEDFRV